MVSADHEAYVEAVTLHEKLSAELRETREKYNSLRTQFEKTEQDLAALQSVGQFVGTILQAIDEDHFIVKASHGPRHVVGAREAIDRKKLVTGARVATDMTTKTIMRVLATEVDAKVFSMISASDLAEADKPRWDQIGGLSDEIYAIREVVELPLTNPEIFERVGISPPKGVLLYGPPGTGKTLIARTLAANVNATFLKIVASSIDDKYIGESARIVRDMFAYAREHTPAVIFIDEIDAIGGKRLNKSTSSDREVQRTMMELLHQMDGFKDLGGVKVIMATNRPDILDPALLRPGRLDRKIEIKLPNDQGRYDILKIHTRGMSVSGDIDFEPIVKMSEGFNGADLRNVCTEAGMEAIRDNRGEITQDDLVVAARKLAEAKKLESKLEYTKV